MGVIHTIYYFTILQNYGNLAIAVLLFSCKIRKRSKSGFPFYYIPVLLQCGKSVIAKFGNVVRRLLQL